MLSTNYRPDDSRFFEQFQQVDVKETGLWVRWLWPDKVEPEEIDRELKAMHDAGIAGAEIGLHAMATTWGTDEYFQGLIWAMESAKKYGMKLDFFMTVGTLCLPQWALKKDDDAAEKILVYADSRVKTPGGKTSVTLSIPKHTDVVVTTRLVAVTYHKILAETEAEVTLSETDCGVLYADQLHLERLTVSSPNTLWELFGKSSEDKLLPYGYDPVNHKFKMDMLEQHPELMEISVNFPQGGEYAVFAYWEIPSDKTFGGVTQYCCDHYSILGTKAVTDYYDRAVEKFPRLGELLHQVGRAFFCDSLENNGNWTMKILDRYFELFGRDFTTSLYAIANGPWRVRPEMAPPPAEDVTGVVKGQPVDAGPRPPHYGLPFAMPDFDAGHQKYASENLQALRNSYYEAMTRCFIENHILAYQEWADKYGMDIRYQSTYGQKMYMGQVSQYIDMAETESLAYRDEVDGYRAQAASVHMRRNGSGILSSEQGENTEDQFHTTTWSGDFLWRTNRFYVSGGNQLVYHVFSYTKYDTPMRHGNGNMVWPGFRPQPNVGDNLQLNRPTMGFMQDYSGYIARSQLMLRTGEAKLDTAIVYHCYNNDRWDFDRFYHSDALDRAGYSYEFADPDLFNAENAVVQNGVLASDGPGYRALLLKDQTYLPLETAEKLLAYAQAGLPLIFAGSLPEKDAYSPEQDQAVAEITKKLLPLPNVYVTTDVEAWPQLLEQAGVQPSLRPNGAALMYAHRESHDADYYFLYNQKKYFSQEDMWTPLADIDTEITLRCTPGRKPYLLHLWSGEITPVQNYTVTEVGVSMRLRLKGNDTAAIVLAEDSWYHGDANVPLGALVDTVHLCNWSLKLYSHEPGEKALCGDDLTDTVVVPHDFGSIGEASPWTQLATKNCKGEDISGVGVYETKIFWSHKENYRVLLDLGAVCDLYKLTVNGKVLPGANPVDPVQEITAYLTDGENAITVAVASNFFHAERSRNYLSTNWVERKSFTAWDFGILGRPVLRLHR